MKAFGEILFARRPPLNYVSPPVCENVFSASSFSPIVVPPFDSAEFAPPANFTATCAADGLILLSWSAHARAVCYNIYTDDGSGNATIFHECVGDTQFLVPPGCYRVSAITLEGETHLSDAVCKFCPEVITDEATGGSCIEFADIPYDDFEKYTDQEFLNGLNCGFNGTVNFEIDWIAPYVARSLLFGVTAEDDMEDYSDGAAVDGLNAGQWDHSAPYVARELITGIRAKDNMESYADGTAVNGLNGGTGFTAAYVAR